MIWWILLCALVVLVGFFALWAARDRAKRRRLAAVYLDPLDHFALRGSTVTRTAVVAIRAGQLVTVAPLRDVGKLAGVRPASGGDP